MNKTHYNTHEKSIPIKIKKIKMPKDKNDLTIQYDLKQTFFDPFKSSPPNEFMNKLNIRYFLHHKKNDNLDNE
jgi:hypothetical protein